MAANTRPGQYPSDSPKTRCPDLDAASLLQGRHPGFVVLTGERLLFVPEGTAAAGPIMDVHHSAIEALSLGKRISGETLSISLAERIMEISRLGHGEGHGIATSLREAAKERARTAPVAHGDG